MDFEEFLWALGMEQEIINRAKECVSEKKELPETLYEKFSELYRICAAVGGMPECMKKYVETADLEQCRKIQADILSDYREDIQKYAVGNDKTRATACLDSIPKQLASGYSRFRYLDIENRTNAGFREYSTSIEWLKGAGIIELCYALDAPVYPLSAGKKPKTFKIYMKGTGLLISMLDRKTVAALIFRDTGVDLGTVMENAICESLTKTGFKAMYFERNGRLEIDFIIDLGSNIAAVEVKTGKGRTALSLNRLMSEFNMIGIRFEDSNIFTDDKGITHYPLFASSFFYPEKIELKADYKHLVKKE